MIQWMRYFFHLDLSAVAEPLQGLDVGTVLDKDNAGFLVDELNHLDEGKASKEWLVTEGAVEWNLHGAEVVYNGPNSPEYPTKGVMGQVVILKLPETTVAPQGLIYLAYNV